MRTTLVLAALALGTAPAHAAQGVVTANAGFFGPPTGGVIDVGIVECNAVAAPGSSIDVPIATSISCSVNGVQLQPAVAPGPVVATATAGVLPRVLDICTSAEAMFYDARAVRVYAVTAAEDCIHVEW